MSLKECEEQQQAACYWDGHLDGVKIGYVEGCHDERIWFYWLVFVGIAMLGAGFTVGYMW